MSSMTLEAVNVTMTYQDRLLFHIPSFKISQGDAIYLSGQNGIGKTTLLKIMAGLQKPTRGRLNLYNPSWLERLAGVTRHIGIIYMHQHPYLFDGTVAENVAYGLKSKHFPQKAREQLTMQALHLIGLGSLANKHISILSGGERQKVAMARAWALKPSLLLMDESCANLDSDAIDVQKTMIKSLLDKGSSAVITSHHPNALTQCCNRHWSIENQRLIYHFLDKDCHAISS